MTTYFRAIPQTDVARPDGARTIAGGWAWFTQIERFERGKAAQIIPVSEVPDRILKQICAARPKLGRVRVNRPQIMGILNVTPDSFSDGGKYSGSAHALAHARTMLAAGATVIDVGGESTRPGAVEVPIEAEIARTSPVIAAISKELGAPVSIDTRKAEVAQAALEHGAFLVNDVSGLTFDSALAPLCAQAQAVVCVMHTQGDPQTMQNDPTYEDVLLDVYDFLEDKVQRLEALGLARSNIVIDPGIGFGKTMAHNLRLLSRISLFHSLGCSVLLGASRKRFIGTIGNVDIATERMPGSLAVALEAIAQGVQILRVHDVAETRQAVSLWQAVTTGEVNDA